MMALLSNGKANLELPQVCRLTEFYILNIPARLHIVHILHRYLQATSMLFLGY